MPQIDNSHSAVKRVIKGDSAFCIMGDWADGEFRVAGLKYGKDYGAFLVPGTQKMYGLNVDVFLHPRGIVDEADSIRWLKVAASREGQDAFNLIKGSVPARSDAEVARLRDLDVEKAAKAIADSEKTAKRSALEKERRRWSLK